MTKVKAEYTTYLERAIHSLMVKHNVTCYLYKGMTPAIEKELKKIISASASKTNIK